MAEAKKCKHPPCECAAREGSDYCGAYCEGAGSRYKFPFGEVNCGPSSRIYLERQPAFQ
jgi:hypothetical protein